MIGVSHAGVQGRLRLQAFCGRRPCAYPVLCLAELTTGAGASRRRSVRCRARLEMHNDSSDSSNKRGR